MNAHVSIAYASQIALSVFAPVQPTSFFNETPYILLRFLEGGKICSNQILNFEKWFKTYISRIYPYNLVRILKLTKVN